MTEVIVGILVGALITWAVAYVYYKRAGDELRGETAELRKLMTIMLTAMERQGWAKLNRDSSGNIIGFVFEITPGSGELTFSGSLEAKHVAASTDDKSLNRDGT